jgi:hypothetical protein
MRGINNACLVGGALSLAIALNACQSTPGSTASESPRPTPSVSTKILPSTDSTSLADSCSGETPAPSVSPTPTGPPLTIQEAASAWLRLTAPVSKQGASGFNAIENLSDGKLTISQFKIAISPFLVAETNFHNGIGAESWPPAVQPATDLAFMTTGKVVDAIRLLDRASPSCFKSDISQINADQTEEYGIGQTIRKILGLPAS